MPKEVRADVAQTFLDVTSSGDLAIRDQPSNALFKQKRIVKALSAEHLRVGKAFAATKQFRRLCNLIMTWPANPCNPFATSISFESWLPEDATVVLMVYYVKVVSQWIESACKPVTDALLAWADCQHLFR